MSIMDNVISILNRIIPSGELPTKEAGKLLAFENVEVRQLSGWTAGGSGGCGALHRPMRAGKSRETCWSPADFCLGHMGWVDVGERVQEHLDHT